MFHQIVNADFSLLAMVAIAVVVIGILIFRH